MLRRRQPRGQPADERVLLRRVLLSFAIMFAAGGAGSVGYYLLWRDDGATFIDASYMTFITMTTIGFQEVRPLATPGRLLTMAVAVVGIGSFFYLLTSVMEFLVATQFGSRSQELKMQKKIDALSGHVLLAGLGRVGRQAAEELSDAGTPFVVVDPSETAQAYAVEHGFLFLRGDCTADEVLERAGLLRASGLIVTTNSDATNLYVVIAARLLNPKLRIVSRAVDEASTPKLLRAGADRAINPYAISGRRLAHLLSRPSVVDFFETAMQRQAIGIEDIEVPEGAVARGLTVGGLRAEGAAAVVAVLRGDTPVPNPDPALKLLRGDRLLALGTQAQLSALGQRLS